MMNAKNSSKTKAQRQAEARERARIMREAQQRKEKRNKQILVWSALAAVVALGVVIALLVSQNLSSQVASSGTAPNNMNASGGIALDRDGALKSDSIGEVDMESLKPSPEPTGDPNSPQDLELDGLTIKDKGSADPMQVIVYSDAMCPFCGAFEQANGQVLKEKRLTGEIVVESRVVSFLDRTSAGGNYSTRAANALACVADVSPNSYADYYERIFSSGVQPEEGTKGLENQKLIDLAAEAGSEDISSCVRDRKFAPFVQYVSEDAIRSFMRSTPTIIVDGEMYSGNADNFKEFLQKKIDAKK